MDQMLSQDNVFWLLMQLSLKGRRDFTQIAGKDFGMTWAQMHALCILDATPVSMHYIADQMVCDASNVTGIVDRLEAQGYATRQDTPNDRRRKVIALTPSGAELREKLLTRISSLEPSYLKDLKPEERLLLKLLLQKILPPNN